jgi:hypothetical protein
MNMASFLPITAPISRARSWRGVGILLVAAMVAATLLPHPAHAQKTRKPLAKSEVLELLENSVSPTRIEELARQYGVAFEMTSGAERELRDAGAADELVKVLRELAPKPSEPPPATQAPASPPPSAAPAAPPPPVLMIETTPPGAEVYIDEERAGKTGPEGKLKISTLASGEHRLRVSLSGYQDYARSLDLPSGQTTMVAIALEAVKPAAVAPPAQQAATAVSPPAGAAGAPSEAPADVYKAMMAAISGQADGGSANPNMKRFYVTHQHGGGGLRTLGYGAGMCYGWLAIGEGRVQYSSNSEDHAFDVPASDVTEVQIKSNHINLRVKDKKYHLVTQDMGPFGGGAGGSPRKAFEAVGIKPKD